jgi:hypothetical protein
MVCTPCQERKRKLRQMKFEKERAKKGNPNIFFKGNKTNSEIVLHGKLPLYCEAFEKMCVVAVYQQCDKKECLIGTPRFDEILNKLEEEHQEDVEE